LSNLVAIFNFSINLIYTTIITDIIKNVNSFYENKLTFLD